MKKIVPLLLAFAFMATACAAPAKPADDSAASDNPPAEDSPSPSQPPADADASPRTSGAPESPSSAPANGGAPADSGEIAPPSGDIPAAPDGSAPPEHIFRFGGAGSQFEDAGEAVTGKISEIVGNMVTLKLIKPLQLQVRQGGADQAERPSDEEIQKRIAERRAQGGGDAVYMGPGGAAPGASGAAGGTTTRTRPKIEVEYTGEEKDVVIPVGTEIRSGMSTTTFDKLAADQLITVIYSKSEPEKILGVMVMG